MWAGTFSAERVYSCGCIYKYERKQLDASCILIIYFKGLRQQNVNINVILFCKRKVHNANDTTGA